MPVIQTRVFRRTAGLNGLDAAIDMVTAEVNTFLNTFANPSDVLDIHYFTGQDMTRSNANMLHMATVIYIEN